MDCIIDVIFLSLIFNAWNGELMTAGAVLEGEEERSAGRPTGRRQRPSLVALTSLVSARLMRPDRSSLSCNALVARQPPGASGDSSLCDSHLRSCTAASRQKDAGLTPSSPNADASARFYLQKQLPLQKKKPLIYLFYAL